MRRGGFVRVIVRDVQPGCVRRSGAEGLGGSLPPRSSATAVGFDGELPAQPLLQLVGERFRLGSIACEQHVAIQPLSALLVGEAVPEASTSTITAIKQWSTISRGPPP